MPADFWTHIQTLQGKTLHTVAQRKPFTVTKVTDDEVEFRIHESGNTRTFHRSGLEPFWRRLVVDGEFMKLDLKKAYGFSSSYAIALLASYPGVRATTNPIILRYRGT